MTGDHIPIESVDPYTGLTFRFTNPREVTMHGYKCPCCAGIIDLCHNVALFANSLMQWEDSNPVRTLPCTQDFDLVG